MNARKPSRRSHHSSRPLAPKNGRRAGEAFTLSCAKAARRMPLGRKFPKEPRRAQSRYRLSFEAARRISTSSLPRSTKFRVSHLLRRRCIRMARFALPQERPGKLGQSLGGHPTAVPLDQLQGASQRFWLAKLIEHFAPTAPSLLRRHWRSRAKPGHACSSSAFCGLGPGFGAEPVDGIGSRTADIGGRLGTQISPGSSRLRPGALPAAASIEIA